MRPVAKLQTEAKTAGTWDQGSRETLKKKNLRKNLPSGRGKD